MKMFKFLWIFFILLGQTELSAKVAIEPVEQYIEAARAKASQGDLEAAAGIYLKALKLQEDNLTARKELANLLLEAELNEGQPENASSASTSDSKSASNDNIIEARRWYRNNAKRD